MAFDPDTIAPEAKRRLIPLGKRWSSEDTLTQAGLTLNGATKYGAKIAKHGFGEEDTVELQGYKQALIDAGVGREGERVGKKTTNRAYAGLIVEAKRVRKRAQTVTTNTRGALEKTGGEAASAAILVIDAVLKQVSVVSEDANGLATQFEQLAGVLKNETVAAAAKGRGGPDTLKAIEAMITKLREVSSPGAQPRGTPAATDLLDLIDGLIVESARSARRAATCAADELGDDAILKAFELTALERPSSSTAAAVKVEPPPVVTPPGDVSAPNAPPEGGKPPEGSTGG